MEQQNILLLSACAQWNHHQSAIETDLRCTGNHHVACAIYLPELLILMHAFVNCMDLPLTTYQSTLKHTQANMDIRLIVLEQWIEQIDIKKRREIIKLYNLSTNETQLAKPHDAYCRKLWNWLHSTKNKLKMIGERGNWFQAIVT